MAETKRALDQYGPNDMALPTWKLVQNVGSDYAKSQGAKPGDFYCSLTEELAKELELVVVDIRTQRTYWGRNEIEDSPPDCASLDSKNMVSMDGKDCRTCQYRSDTPWTLKPTERRQRCNTSYNILGINTADSMPVLIRASGISALSARQLITLLCTNKKLRGEYHRALVGVASAKKKTPSGEAYTMHFKIKGLISDEAQADELKNQSLQLLGIPLALPESRPEEEQLEPIVYTPEGQPVYTEEERQKLEAVQAGTPPKTETQAAADQDKKDIYGINPLAKAEEKKEPNKKELDLNF